MPDPPIGPIYAQVAAGLRAGWARVRRGSPMAGADGVSTAIFGLRLDEELKQLADELRSRTYETGPLFRFSIPKPNGERRTLGIPTVRDRVVQAAALEVLQPRLEEEFEASSFAYRPGRSWQGALRRLEALRDDGYTWVVDADVDSYFDSVNHDLLMERIAAFIPDADVQALLRQWVTADAVEQGRRIRRSEGLPQGAIISPILANLFLDDLDEALAEEGFRLVRYADDFVVLCRSEARAEDALELTDAVLERLGLELHAGKTRLTSFEQGFKFLGTLFVRSLMLRDAENPIAVAPTAERVVPDRTARKKPDPPPATVSRERLERTALGRALLHALDAEGITMDSFVSALAAPEGPAATTMALRLEESEPEREAGNDVTEAREGNGETLRPGERSFRRTLYVQHQGAWLRLNAGRFVVTSGRDVQDEVISVPTVLVEQIVVFGHTLITPAALRHCLRENIPVTLLSSQGKYYGSVESTLARDVTRQRLQFLRGLDGTFRLDLARRFVRGRLHNQRVLLRRYARRLDAPAIRTAAEELSRLLRRLDKARDLDTLRGLEGQAAATYFAVFDEMLHSSPFAFEQRTRRPPTDPVNALLSFGYTLLHHNLYALARVHRLNPYVGVLHAERHGHPALVSDLIEEFRFVIERLVLRLCNEGRFDPEDFTTPAERPGCYLVDESRRFFIGAFEREMRREVKHPATGRPTPYRRCLDLQVRAFARHLEGGTPYAPFMLG